MTDGVSTTEAARRLKTTPPTVRALLASGGLKGRKVTRGTKFAWLVDEASIETYVATNGHFVGTRRPSGSRLRELEEDVVALRAAIDVGRSSIDGLERVRRQRDDLRAKVMTLEDALARARTVAELQRRADAERAAMVDHLLAAVSAGERADELRRSAIAEMEDGLTAASQSGHLGELGA